VVDAVEWHKPREAYRLASIAAGSVYQFAAVALLRETLSEVRAHTRTKPLDATRREQLRQRVYVAVDDLKGMGWTPERVIIAVKSIATEVGFRPSPHFSRANQPLVNGDALLASIVRWTIERYYHVDPRPR
jgi:hypothetical protein